MAITGADIKVRFGSEGAGQVTSDIKRVGGAVDDVSKKGSGFLGTMKQVAGGFILGNVLMAGTGAVLGFGKSLISGSADLEQFHTQLEVATGSSEKATKIMDNMISMAKKTPFEQAELIRGAANLESLGQASEKWMPIIADTSAGVNKSIDETVQAVLDAQTGEFERLKEFGIRTKVEGDKVKFTFMKNGKEMVVEANNTSEGISTALMGIWDDKYDGAMEKLSNSFTGRLSTLKDNIFLLAQGGFAPVFDTISAGLNRINEAFTQAETEGWGAAIRDLISDTVGSLTDIAIDVGGVVIDIAQWVMGAIPDVWEAIKRWIVGGNAGANGESVPLGDVAVAIAGWLPKLGDGVKSLWDAIKDKAAEWLGLKPDPIPVPVVDLTLDDIKVSLGDGVDIWGDVEDLVSSIAGTGGSRVGGGGALAGVGIRNAIKLPPVRVEVAEFDVDVSAGDLWDAITAKVDAMITPDAASVERFRPKGREIGRKIMDGLIDAIRGVFTSDVSAGGGSAAGGAGPLGAGGSFGGGLWQYLEPIVDGAMDELETRFFDWLNHKGNEIRQSMQAKWNAFVPSLFEFQLDTAAGGGGALASSLTGALGGDSLLQQISDSIFEKLNGGADAIKSEFDAWWEGIWDFDIPVPSLDIPMPDFNWPDPPSLDSIPKWVRDPVGWVKDQVSGDDDADKASNSGLGGMQGGGPGRGDSFMGGMASKVAAMASAIGGYAEQAVASITSVGDAFGSLDGTTATVSILGDNVAALAAVDASAMAVGGINGMAAMTFINGDNSNALGAIGEAAGQMAAFDGTVATGYLEAINNVGGAVAAAINALDAFNGRTATATINVVGSGIGSIPRFAEGGYVRNRIAMVGEEGPELVSLPVGSYVHTASKTRQMLAGGGGPPVTINAPLTIEHHGEMTDADFLRFSRIHVQGMATAFNNVRRSQGVA